MRLLLTALSVLAGWSLLAVIAAGLLLILKPLERIRRHLEQITMGVRAIEQQTMPLGAHASALAASFDRVAGTVGASGRRLADVDRHLDAATAERPALRPRR